MTRRHAALAAVLTATGLVLGAGGCGGEDGGNGDGGERGQRSPAGTVAATPGRTVPTDGGRRSRRPARPRPRAADVVLTEYEITARGASPRSGSFTVVNRGEVEHNLTLRGTSVDLAPGDTTVITLLAGAEGTVATHCRLHRDRGMRGRLRFAG